jgi:hypothetical protein
MLRRRNKSSSSSKHKQETVGLREELMLLRRDLAAMQTENEALKEQLIPLIEQVQMLSRLIDWDTLPVEVYYRLRSTAQTGDFMKMYDSLSDRFTLNDLIASCEQHDVNVFIAYEHIKAFLLQGKLAEETDFFTKQRLM